MGRRKLLEMGKNRRGWGGTTREESKSDTKGTWERGTEQCRKSQRGVEEFATPDNERGEEGELGEEKRQGYAQEEGGGT